MALFPAGINGDRRATSAGIDNLDAIEVHACSAQQGHGAVSQGIAPDRTSHDDAAAVARGCHGLVGTFAARLDAGCRPEDRLARPWDAGQIEDQVEIDGAEYDDHGSPRFTAGASNSLLTRQDQRDTGCCFCNA